MGKIDISQQPETMMFTGTAAAVVLKRRTTSGMCLTVAFRNFSDDFLQLRNSEKHSMSRGNFNVQIILDIAVELVSVLGIEIYNADMHGCDLLKWILNDKNTITGIISYIKKKRKY